MASAPIYNLGPVPDLGLARKLLVMPVCLRASSATRSAWPACRARNLARNRVNRTANGTMKMLTLGE